MTMLQLAGPTAETAFRLRKLLERLGASCPAIRGVESRYEHFVHLQRALDEHEESVLAALLHYGLAGEPVAGDVALHVIPRLGTISPWASKATDIARICGLPVHRIERGRVFALELERALTPDELASIKPLLHDRMTETCLARAPLQSEIFSDHEPKPVNYVPVASEGGEAIRRANVELGLALSPDEIEYVAEQFGELGRDPTDMELMMFAQVNSEHCRHKVFNADWIIDGSPAEKSLFGMIRNTHEVSPEGVLSAYKDNAAVVEGAMSEWFFPSPSTAAYEWHAEPADLVMKVETHNHPTAISPFPGAATGSGGEIRDEGATGRGAKPKAGLTGFTVSHLQIPGWSRPWEQSSPGKPGRIASALNIMLEGPIGGASFNNEFGRPNISGYFRTCLLETGGQWRGYHKPIMIAGGVGNVRRMHVEKETPGPGAKLIVLGGPAMLIGLGGGAASSVGSGTGEEALDFASVQRGNPEMQRRCQEVIDTCTALDADNPIAAIHDIGAGGLSNALPEIVDHSHAGAEVDLRAVPNDEPGMSPMELWCNESQERYMLSIEPERLEAFIKICERERCPYAVLGTLTAERDLVVSDASFGDVPVAMPMDLLFAKPPKMTREAKPGAAKAPAWSADDLSLAEAIDRVLTFAAVADKSFLIHIGDRTVGGLVSRDQLIGPWQVPVSDVAVTSSGFRGYTGEAMAMGERTPVAMYDGPASARLAVVESVMNILAADVESLSDIRLSANWMAAAGHENDDYALFEMVRAVGEVLCPALGIAIPVGKDSLSMRTTWSDGNSPRAVTAPVSLIVSAFAPVTDVRRTLTPQLAAEAATRVLAIDLSAGFGGLGGSALAQACGQFGGEPADVEDAARVVGFFQAQRELRAGAHILAYHDRSDGGWFAALAEMAFASRLGLSIDVPETGDVLGFLFSEAPGALIQVRDDSMPEVMKVLLDHGLQYREIAVPRLDERIELRQGGRPLHETTRGQLHACWSEMTFRMQALRDDPECASEARESTLDESDAGLVAELHFELPREDLPVRHSRRDQRPKVAILREQGVNGQREMAAALDIAGFAPYDVHMTDLLNGRAGLDEFRGVLACGGFSYGDVLGAGEGWAKTILYTDRLREMFKSFFAREDAFALGVCNGCQMLSALKTLVPGSHHWPRFVRNRSDQFEARLSLVEVQKSPSLLLSGMEGSRMPIVVSHGEGRALFADDDSLQACSERLAALRYVTADGAVAERYPANPNGSPLGIAGLSNDDGRITIMMPHPERVFRSVQMSWHPPEWGEFSPWQRLFDNARSWVD